MGAKILVRFDDICPTMDFAQFELAETMMDNYGVKPLIGVIPDCKDPDLKISNYRKDFWDYIKQLQIKGYTVAMHGFNHVFDSPCKGIINNRIGSEFSGLPFEVQLEKIKKGKEILMSHGIDTDIFFAPAHSYDMNTIKALSACGFKYMSDGKSRRAYELYGIKLLPCRSGGCPKNLTTGIKTAVFHAHEWTWPNKKYCYMEFKSLLTNYNLNIVGFQEYSKQKVSNVYLQKIDEFLYVKYEIYIFPILRKIYHLFICK